MATTELTWPEASIIRTYPRRSDLTERDRFVDTRPGASLRPRVEKIVAIEARGQVIQFTYQDNSDALPTWLEPLLIGFANVITLPDNWDGEHASAISRESINQALAAIDQLLDPHSPPPSVVPTPDSGVQLEWHRGGKDLEIEFYSSRRPEFYFFDEASREEHEGPVGPGFSLLKPYLERVW